VLLGNSNNFEFHYQFLFVQDFFPFKYPCLPKISAVHADAAWLASLDVDSTVLGAPGVIN